MNGKSDNREDLSDTRAQLDERDRADLARLAAGHGAALNELMERHSPKLYNYLFQCLQNEDDASDLAQETFVRVYQNRARFDPRTKFSTWLYAIATNLVKDCYRHRTRHPHLSLDARNEVTGEDSREYVPEPEPTPSESLQAAEQAQAVRQAVGELPVELRTPLILSEYQELSHAEIGEILECSEKAVETRLYRARNELRDKLARLLDGSA